MPGTIASSPSTTSISVFLSAPGDALPQKDRLDDCLREISSIVRPAGLTVTSWRHERDALLASGNDPQDVVNDQEPAYDVYVGVTYKKLGTPTPRAASGTAEELARAITRRKAQGSPEVFLFFFDGDKDPALASFQAQYRGLFGLYRDVDDLERKFKHQLMLFLSRQYLGVQTPRSPSKPARPRWVTALEGRWSAGSGDAYALTIPALLRPARMAAKLASVFGLGRLRETEIDTLHAALWLAAVDRRGGSAAGHALAELARAQGWWSGHLAEDALRIHGGQIEETVCNDCGCDRAVIAALAKIAERLTLNRNDMASDRGDQPPELTADLDDWVAYLTPDITVLGPGLVQHVLQVPSIDWVLPAKRCTSLALEAAWQANRGPLTTRGLAMTTATSKVILGGDALPSVILDRLRAAGLDVVDALPRLEHLGAARPEVPLSALVPLPGTAIADSVEIACDGQRDHVLELEWEAGHRPPLRFAARDRFVLDATVLGPAESCRWWLWCDYGLGDLTLVAGGDFRTLREDELSFWANARAIGLDERLEAAMALGLRDELLAFLWERDLDAARPVDLEVVARCHRWMIEAHDRTDREDPASTRIEAYRAAAAWLQTFLE